MSCQNPWGPGSFERLSRVTQVEGGSSGCREAPSSGHRAAAGQGARGPTAGRDRAWRPPALPAGMWSPVWPICSTSPTACRPHRPPDKNGAGASGYCQPGPGSRPGARRLQEPTSSWVHSAPAAAGVEKQALETRGPGRESCPVASDHVSSLNVCPSLGQRGPPPLRACRAPGWCTRASSKTLGCSAMLIPVMASSGGRAQTLPCSPLAQGDVP